MMKMIANMVKYGLSLLLICMWIPQHATAVATSNISTTSKYAWSENTGWQNYRPTHGGVTVNATYLSGFVWAENIGFIELGKSGFTGPYANTTNANWGVNRASNGNLSGYAWSETAGWINFNTTHSQVSISTVDGSFSGFAWGENVGWIHFMNAAPAYNVVTTFIPVIPAAAVAVGDTVISLAMTVTTGNVLANDIGTGLFVSAFDAASVNGGVIVSNGNGVFTYTRPANFVGDDSFTYTVKDSLRRSSVGTVTVVVNGPPSALWVNKYFYRPGDSLALSASITPGTLAGRVVDVYITIRMPTGQTVYLISNGTVSLTPVPYLSNWSTGAGRGLLFNYVFQGTEPLGGYAINGFFTAPGTMTSAGVMAGGNFYFLP